MEKKNFETDKLFEFSKTDLVPREARRRRRGLLEERLVTRAGTHESPLRESLLLSQAAQYRLDHV